MSHSKKTPFFEGMKDAIPIGLGYFAVSFSLGIAAKNLGFTPFQGFLVSLLNNASAGEYAAFTLIEAGASLIEVAIMTFIANARYLLMSTALSQRVDPQMPFYHRLIIAFDVTDELFAINIARPGYLCPAYAYGAYILAALCWASGTACGVIAGNIMPLRLVSAFSVALYGMFLAIIIPPAKKDKAVAVAVIISFLLSYIVSVVPMFKAISSGTITIILTVVIASAASIIAPRHNELNENEETTEVTE